MCLLGFQLFKIYNTVLEFCCFGLWQEEPFSCSNTIKPCKSLKRFTFCFFFTFYRFVLQNFFFWFSCCWWCFYFSLLPVLLVKVFISAFSHTLGLGNVIFLLFFFLNICTRVVKCSLVALGSVHSVYVYVSF